MKYLVSELPKNLLFCDGDETIIFHPASSDLYMFDALGMKIFNVLMQKPLTQKEIIVALSVHDIPTLLLVNNILSMGVEQGLIEEIPE